MLRRLWEKLKRLFSECADADDEALLWMILMDEEIGD